MKKLLWTSALALTAMACLTACDESGTDSGLSIAEYKTASALPDTCSMEVAKVDTTYFACQENKWIEVTDSATVEKIKEGSEESDLQEVLEEMAEVLPTPDKKQSSSSSKKVESSADKGSVEPESSASEDAECTGRRCGSSSSKKKDNSGSGNGGSTTPSSTGSAGSGSGSSTGSAGSGSGSSTSGPTVSKCGDEFINEKDYFCYKDTKYERCNGESYIPDGDHPEKCVLAGSSYVVTTFCYISSSSGDSVFYNKKISFCTGSAIASLCGGKSYDYPNTEFCYKDQIATFCNDQVYDPATEVCTAQPSGDDAVSGLCGDIIYDYLNQQCSGTSVSLRPSTGTYDVTLQSAANEHKIALIKAVKETLGIGLTEAKSLVDNAPSLLKEGLSIGQALDLKITLAKNGGVSTITAVGACPTYDEATEFCYKGSIYDLCGGKEYDPTAQKCEGSAILDCSADVYLEDYGSQKIAVIKVVREYTGLGLTDAKALVEAAPVTLYKAMGLFKANDFLKDLINAGATASLKNSTCSE